MTMNQHVNTTGALEPRKRKVTNDGNTDTRDIGDVIEQVEHPPDELQSVDARRSRMNLQTLIYASRKVEHEEGDTADTNAIPMLPPDDSFLCPVQKFLLIDLWCDNQLIVEQALQSVGDLCTAPNVGVANRAAVHRASGAQMITCAMRKWYYVPSLQAHGCRVLTAAASTLGVVVVQATGAPAAAASKRGFRQSALDAGALEAVVWAMNSYPDSHAVQAYGCGALGNLCTIQENAAHVVGMLNGHLHIVAAMKNFPQCTDILRIGSHALTNLSGLNAELRTCMVNAGCRQALLEAIDTHKDETKEHVKDMQKWARLALKNLL